MIEINAPLANCGSQSEFVEKAVRFYDGYLKVQNAGAFLPHAVADVLKGTLGVSANRMAKMLFNLTVEHNITNHLLAADVDMTREEYNKLRGGSVREVTSTRVCQESDLALNKPLVAKRGSPCYNKISVLQVAHSGQQQPNLLPCQMDTPCTRCCRDIRPRRA